MKRIITLGLLLCALTINAQIVQVSGNQSGTWSGEIHLIGDVMIPDGETLTVDAGTSVIADGYFGMTVLGNLYAIGEEGAWISFTVADTTGYSDYDNPELGGWKGLYFHKPGSVELRYCDFSYGKTHAGGDGGVMRISMANGMEIANCRFHHNTTRRRGGAVYAENSSMLIHDSEVCDNLSVACPPDYTWGVGFQFLKCDLNIHDMVFHGNISESAYGGGMNIDSCNMVLTNAVFYDNHVVNAGGLGIQRCKEYNVKVSNMLAYNNSVIHYGGGMAMATSDPELNNITLVNNYCGGGGGAGFQTAFDAAPTLNNCIIWGNHAIANINSKGERDTVEYYDGSQIWLWGMDCRPVFNNGVVQYGLDSIYGREYVEEDDYNDMIDADPLFVDELHHDYRLLADSPCIDTGLEDISGLFIPDTDLSGGPRVFNDRIDMGCYEWNNIGVGEVVANMGNLSVYPNPLNYSAYCEVNLSRKTDVVIRLISLDGKEVYRENCGVFGSGLNRISLATMVESLEKTNKMYILSVDNQYIKIVY